MYVSGVVRWRSGEHEGDKERKESSVAETGADKHSLLRTILSLGRCEG